MTNEDIPIIIDVLANDTDPDGDLNPGSVTITTLPAHGSTSVNPVTGSVTYTSTLNYNGSDSFVYQVCDTTDPPLCDTATVTVTINAVDDPPNANDDTASTNEDTLVQIYILTNDTDPEGNIDSHSLKVTVPPAHGSTSVNPGQGRINYTPTANYNGSDSFQYQVCDTTNLCDTATVTVTINPVNDPPVAVNDSYTALEDQTLTVDPPGVLSNDTDVDLDPLTAVLVSGAQNGTLSLSPDGSFTYQPNLNYTGSDSFTYLASDGLLNSNTATVNLTVLPFSTPPVAADDTASTNEDTAVAIDVLANDTDPDGNLDPTSVSITTPPANGTAVPNPVTGVVTYTPNLNTNGADSFVYQVCDTSGACDTATVTVTINPVNDPPVAVNDAYTTTEDTTLSITPPGVLANDVDVDQDTLNAALVSDVGHGSLTLNPDGSFTYTPALNYNGDDSFTYVASDGLLNSNTAIVTIHITPVVEPPIANDDTAVTDEDTSVVIDVLANDTDPDNNLDPTSVSITNPPVNGATSVNPATGAVTYTPDPNYNGADSFIYQVCDLDNACDSATVSLTVNPVNDAPVAVNDSYGTIVNQPINIGAPGVLGNDTDADNDALTASLVNDVQNGTLAFNPDGSFTYTPDNGYLGSDSFTYTASDGQVDSNLATVTITILPTNDPPIANDDTASTNEDTSVNIAVLANDIDPDGNLDPTSVTITTLPGDGSTAVNPVTGVVTYTPNANFNGSDSFIYQVCDTVGACDSATVSVTVNAVNDPPVANGDTAFTNEDFAVVIDVLSNDTDVEGDIDPASVTVIDPPANGNTSVDAGSGDITYTPDLNTNGTDDFQYEVCDTQNACDSATVTVTVNPVNDPPSVHDDTAVTNEDTAVVINVLANDTDPENDIDPASVLVTALPQNGSTSVNPLNGQITYTPNLNYNGGDSFTYEVCDLGNLCGFADVAVTVQAVNDPPVANADNASTPEDQPVTIDVLDNDVDVDGNLDPTSVTITQAPGHGSTSVDPLTGEVTYTPSLNYTGLDDFEYQVCDTNLACDRATVSVTVGSDNDPPVAVDDKATTPEDTPIVIDVLANDSDPDGDLDPTSVTIIDPPDNGTAVASPTDGKVTYTPDGNYNGPDAFVYQVCDFADLCAAATVSVTVTPVDDKPVALDDNPITTEDTAFDIVVLANDSDVDGNLDPTSVTLDTYPVNGSAVVNPSTGVITYTPHPNYNGTDTFDYHVCDTTQLCDSATVDVTITPVNDIPVGLSDPYSVLYREMLTVPAPGVLGNDSDPDGDPLTAILDEGPEHAEPGSFVLNADGSFTYQPAVGFVNQYDHFTYHAFDGTAESDVITVQIYVYDLSSPTISWLEPVTDGMQYDVSGETVLLKVNAQDDVGVTAVDFWWWDADAPPFGQLVHLGTVTSAPYQLYLDTSILNPQFNEIIAKAYDGSGNSSGETWIWLYRGTFRVFMPLISK